MVCVGGRECHHGLCGWQGVSPWSVWVAGSVIMVCVGGRECHRGLYGWLGVSSWSVWVAGSVIMVCMGGRECHHGLCGWLRVSSWSVWVAGSVIMVCVGGRECHHGLLLCPITNIVNFHFYLVINSVGVVRVVVAVIVVESSGPESKSDQDCETVLHH